MINILMKILKIYKLMTNKMKKLKLKILKLKMFN